ncbi:hypothetical protein AOT81_03215 [Xylella fastidiosa]|nr:hypothetical protein AOT81_03215 [Xylella fastidiosa]
MVWTSRGWRRQQLKVEGYRVDVSRARMTVCWVLQGCVVEGVLFMMYGVIDDVLFWEKRWVITVIFWCVSIFCV